MAKVTALAAPQLGSCAASGRAWPRGAARYSQGEAGFLGAQPPPRLLEPVASKVAHFPAFWPSRSGCAPIASITKAGAACSPWVARSHLTLTLTLALTLTPTLTLTLILTLTRSRDSAARGERRVRKRHGRAHCARRTRTRTRTLTRTRSRARARFRARTRTLPLPLPSPRPGAWRRAGDCGAQRGVRWSLEWHICARGRRCEAARQPGPRQPAERARGGRRRRVAARGRAQRALRQRHAAHHPACRLTVLPPAGQRA